MRMLLSAIIFTCCGESVIPSLPLLAKLATISHRFGTSGDKVEDANKMRRRVYYYGLFTLRVLNMIAVTYSN